MSQVKLEICIQAFNRHIELRELLDQLNDIYQYNENFSCLIGDYSTEASCAGIIEKISKSYVFTRYYKGINRGIDFGFSELVERSIGRYCWLMSDDDHVKSDQARIFLEDGLDEFYDIYILNAEVWSQTFSTKLKDSLISVVRFSEDDYIKSVISYIGSLVIKRHTWIANCDERFFGTYFNHAYVVKNALINSANLRQIVHPILKIRANNALWTTTSFQIWTQHWPRFLHYFNTGMHAEVSSDFRLKNLLYYYSYGSLNRKLLRDIGFIGGFNWVKFQFIFLLNRGLLSWLIVIYMAIKDHTLKGEPQYYLLRSINSRYSNYLIRKYFNEY